MERSFRDVSCSHSKAKEEHLSLPHFLMMSQESVLPFMKRKRKMSTAQHPKNKDTSFLLTLPCAHPHMGNALGKFFHRPQNIHRTTDIGRQPSTRDIGRRPSTRDVGRRPSTRSLMSQPSVTNRNNNAKRRMNTHKYSYIPDNYTSIEQVCRFSVLYLLLELVF